MTRHLRMPLLAALVAVVLWQGIIPALTRIDTDFPNYYTGARLLLDGADCSRIYDNAWFSSRAVAYGLGAQSAFIPFPPATMFVMLPLAWLAPLTALQVWTVLNFLLLMFVVRLLQAATDRDPVWCALIVLGSGRALINNFKFGQFYLVLLALVLLIYLGMKRDRSMAAGIALGVGAAIKYFPAIYIVPLVARKQWRTIAWAVLTACAVTAAGVAVIGVGASWEFATRIAASHVQGDIPGQAHYAAAFESWNSFLRRVFLDDAGAPPSPIINWAAGYAVGLTIVYACVLGAAVYAWRRAARATDVLALRVAVISCAALVLLPASATYHFLLLVLPVALLLAPPRRWRAPEWVLVAACAAIAFLPQSFFRGFDGHGVLTVLAYPRLWLIAIVYGACVALASSQGKVGAASSRA